MIAACQRFRRLSSLERGMFFRGVLLLPTTALALRLIGLRNVERWLDWRRKRDSRGTESVYEKQVVAEAARRMTEAASRYGIIHGNCLSKSMVLWHLLRREGFEAALHVGGRRSSRTFEAHAWVELEGAAINDSADVRKRFAPFQNHASSTPVAAAARREE